MGIWGFFECADDPEAAAALFFSVETWARRKGMTFMRGPLNPSTNYEAGLLIEGFAHSPTLMMTYNPPTTRGSLNRAASPKKGPAGFPDRGRLPASRMDDRLAERISKKKGIHIRPSDPKNVNAEFAMIREIYNLAGP